MSKKTGDFFVDKVSPLLRMLTCPTEGEIVNAVRLLLQTLAGAGLNIHTIVERVERGAEAPLSAAEAPLNAAEMQKIYDKAYEKGFNDGSEHGRRSAVIAAQPIGTFATSVDDGVNGYTWMQIAEHLALNKHLFHGSNLEFVEGMPEKIAHYGHPTPPQAKWLRDLFMRKFGGKIT